MARLWLLLICIAIAAADPVALPDGGEAMLPEDSLAAMRVTAAAGLSSNEIFDVTGMPFRRALRVQVHTAGRQAWDVQILGTTTGDLRQGDVLLLSLFVRGSAGNESGEGFGTAYLQRNSGAFEKVIGLPFQAGSEWKQYLMPVRSDYALSNSQHNFAVHLSALAQTIEIGGIVLLNYRSSRTVAELPKTQITYEGMAADAPWRAEARASIEKIRKGAITVEVRDGAGNPVNGADVRIEQKRHEFPFGSAVAADGLSAGENGDRYREIVRRTFNKVVLENDLKWPNWEANRNRALGALAWLRDNGIWRVRGHTLVWPGWRNMPRDVEALAGDPAALRMRVLRHIEEEVSATRGQLEDWDVLNEPFSNTDLQRILGEEEMAAWFREARRHDPDPRLYINDYSILSNGGFDRAHQDHYFQTIQKLIDWGAPLEGIGMQGHFGSQLTAPVRLWAILDRFAQFGRPVHITEFDINIDDEEVQAAYTRDFLTAVFAHPAVHGFMMWGFWEGRHWIPRAAMFRRDWTLKPNGQAFYDTVFGEFWTDARGRTDDAGVFGTRAFYGEYEVTASAGSRNGKAAVKVTEAGTRVTIVLD